MFLEGLTRLNNPSFPSLGLLHYLPFLDLKAKR